MVMPRMQHVQSLVFPALICLSFGWQINELQAQSTQIREHVRQDVTVYLEIQKLGEFLDTDEMRSIHGRLLETQLIQQWTKSEEFEKMQKVGQTVGQYLDDPNHPSLGELLGATVGLAVNLKSKKPSAIFFIESQAEVVTKLLQLWDRVDPRKTTSLENYSEIYQRSREGLKDVYYLSLIHI